MHHSLDVLLHLLKPWRGCSDLGLSGLSLTPLSSTYEGTERGDGCPCHALMAFSGLSKAVWFPELGCLLLLETLIAFAQGKHFGLEHPIFHPPLGLVLPNKSVPTGAPYNSPDFPTHSTKCFEITASSLSDLLAQFKRQILILTAICWLGPGCLRDSPWIYLFGFIQKSIKKNTPPRLQAHQP